MKTQDALTAFINAGKARGLRPASIKWYELLLGAFARQYVQLPRKVEPLESFMGGLTCGDVSRYDHYRALKVFFSWLHTRYGVANPAQDLTPPKRHKKLPRTLSVAEMGCLFLVPLSKRDRALVLLLLDTGIRVGEAVDLTPDDIGADSILVDGKTGQREVPISAQVRDQLLDIGRGRWVFPGYGSHMKISQAYKIVRAAFITSGLRGKKLGPHTLRHTFGRQFIAAGGDAFSLQRILGHSNIQTTRIYVELNTSDIVRQHHKFTPLHLVQAGSQGRLIDEAESIIRTMRRGEHGQ